ncbi:MAG: hypothetical protein N2Z65_02500 [Clostridiales bacterium]|nr:hypothetical protein [Clostridiales bacterium]
MTEFALPQYVRQTINKLESNGFCTYIVGGCVRDLLLKRKPLDYDIATSALPENIIRYFPSSYPTGLKHGTVTVIVKGHPLEITTFRTDGIYSDGRRPDQVVFASDILEDLKRRDFTINAIAWSEKEGLIDPFCGCDDLSKKIIRCVGEPTERFFEDSLRILRAWRFSATLGFNIEQKTVEAALKLKDRLGAVSAERVHSELCKILLSKHLEILLDLINKGFLIKYGLKNTPNTLISLSKIENDLIIRSVTFAVLLEQNKSIERADTFLSLLRFDKRTVSLTRLVRKIKISFEVPFEIKLGIAKYGLDAVLCAASIFFMETGVNAPQKVRVIANSGECLTLSQLQITGDDLMQKGFPEGREIGILLNKLLLHVLSHPEDNQTEKLTNLAENMKK